MERRCDVVRVPACGALAPRVSLLLPLRMGGARPDLVKLRRNEDQIIKLKYMEELINIVDILIFKAVR